MRSFYEELNQPVYKVASISCVICGLITHGYDMSNKITNHDDMAAGFYNNLSLLSSGRWMPDLFSSKVLGTPWISGLINIVMITLIVVMIVNITRIQSLFVAALTGALWVAFPANTALHFYAMEIPNYSTAIMLAVFSVFLLKKYRLKGMLIAVAMMIASLGIYQAFFPIGAAALLTLLWKYMKHESQNVKDNIIEASLYLSFLLLSLFGYIILTKMICNISGVPLSSYQGIDRAGSLTSEQIINGITQAYKSAFLFHSTIHRGSIVYILLDGVIVFTLGNL